MIFGPESPDSGSDPIPVTPAARQPERMPPEARLFASRACARMVRPPKERGPTVASSGGAWLGWDMDADHFIGIGTRLAWEGETSFGLSRADRRHHLYVLGKTGTGKTTLLRNLILQDIAAGEGVGIIDPHGDLAADLLDHIPSHRTDDVVYFNPADGEATIGLNLMQSVSPNRRHLVTSGIVSALKGVWSDSWGPRLEYILNATIAALLECENTTILGIQRMLVDARYRSWVLRQVSDPMVRAFWLTEFPRYEKGFATEAVAPIQNKVGQLLMAPPIRLMLGQIKSKVDVRFMMDDKRIFIANLSKGALGADKANLIGSLLMTQFQLAAMSRMDLPEASRRDFHLYIDEAHNFMTDAFTSILSEARKYRLCLTLSHQYSSQFRPSTLDAVLGNVGNLISFRVGDQDATVLEREFGNVYPANVFNSLGNYNVVCKLLDHGEPRDPFLGRTLPESGRRHGRGQNILRRSQEKYATPKHLVEDRIRRWMERPF